MGCRAVEFSNEIYLITELRPDLNFKNRVFFLDLFHRAYIISSYCPVKDSYLLMAHLSCGLGQVLLEGSKAIFEP